MKGQWFIVSVVMISGTLLVITGLFKGYFATDLSKIAVMDEDYYFSDIKDNLQNLVRTSTCDDLSKNLDAFIYFTRQRLTGTGYYLFVNKTMQCTIQFYDSFETANALWTWDSGWNRLPVIAMDGSYSAQAKGNITDASLTMANSINLESAGLKFSWFINDKLTVSDYVCLDLYDGTWEEYKCLRNDTTEDVWLNESIKLNPTPEFKLRFRATLQIADMRVYVDNVTISYPTSNFGILLASNRMIVYENVNPKDIINLTS